MNRKELLRITGTSLFAVLISAFILADENLSFERFEGGIIAVLISFRFYFMHTLLIGIAAYSTTRLIKKRMPGYLFPLAFCMIHFAIIITMQIKRNIRESSPVILKADYFGDINGLTLYLRQNNTYKLSDNGFYGGTNHYGEYRISGDTILLSEKYPLGPDRDVMSNKLLIQKGFILIKQDSKGNFVENQPFVLRIVARHRKF